MINAMWTELLYLLLFVFLRVLGDKRHQCKKAGFKFGQRDWIKEQSQTYQNKGGMEGNEGKRKTPRQQKWDM